MVFKSIDHEKEKINCVTITSFLWSALLSTIALDQSAREKSLNYCNKCPHNGKPLDSVQVSKSEPFYWCRKTSLQSKYWLEFIICLFLLTTILCLHPYTMTAHIDHLLSNFWLQNFFSGLLLLLFSFTYLLNPGRRWSFGRQDKPPSSEEIVRSCCSTGRYHFLITLWP